MTEPRRVYLYRDMEPMRPIERKLEAYAKSRTTYMPVL